MGELNQVVPIPGGGIVPDTENKLAPGVGLEVPGLRHHLAKEVDEAEFAQFRDFHRGNYNTAI